MRPQTLPKAASLYQSFEPHTLGGQTIPAPSLVLAYAGDEIPGEVFPFSPRRGDSRRHLLPSWLRIEKLPHPGRLVCMGKFRDWQRELTSEPRLRESIERLRQDGCLSVSEAERLQLSLPELLRNSHYVLRHLGAHFAVGVIFAFDFLPLPMGMISRGLWVIGNRIYETVRGHREEAAVHSLPVFGVALVPFVGYFAYLIPLRARNADAAYLFANHLTYLRSGCSLEAYLAKKPAWLGRLVRSIVSTAPKPVAESSATIG
jgi:hypothetical protein